MKKFVLFLGLMAFVSISNFSIAQMVDVTFRVDMQEQTVAAEGVHIAGSFPAPLPTWDPAGIPLDPPPLGTVYTTTLSLEVGTTVEFKYVNGNAWGQDEAVPPCCAQNNNRFYTVQPGGETLDVVCYGSCIPCNSSPTLWDITFQVDLSDATYTTGAYIAGNLQDPQWTPEPMIDMGDDIFQITLSLEEDECYQYKFVIDGSGWEIVPEECRSHEENRFYEVPDYDETIDLVCYGSCVGCNPVDVTFSVNMENETVIEGVFVAGSFNGWNTTATPLTDMGSNIWETTLTLQDGQDVEYKFINGTVWEDIPAACSWGGGNRHFIISENPLILETVCFGACNPCSPTNTVDVTFVADMSSQLISGNVFLAGDFNDWTPGATTMTHTGNSIYEATLTLGEGFIYGYKFIINDSVWEIVPGDCNYNDVRTVIVPAANTTLPTDCFNECGACTTTLYRFNLSVFLEGPFNGTDMNTKLYDDGVLPLDQPFNTAPWNYDGQETITVAPDADIVDWLYIQFRETSGDASTALSDSLLDHQAAVLLSNGTVATPDGSATIFYTGNIAKNLYVVIYHRNHLAVMSATPLVDILGIYAYDFTNNLSNAYNEGHKLLGGGMYGMISGDSDANGTVDLNDKDVNWNNEAGSAGYYGSDLNLDGQSNNPDKNDFWEPNLTQETQIPE